MNAELPETLQEAITYFACPDRALEFVKAIRWPDGVVRCAWCSAANAHFMAKRRIWKCRDCRKQFSVKVGTIFEDSPLKLETWLPAVWLIVNAKNGISSCELARGLDVTQKTAWFMLQRIRLAMQNGSIVKVGGTVEVDETYIGGKARNMHKAAKERRGMTGKGTGQWHLTPVQGLLERTTAKRASRVILKHVEKNTKATLDPNVRKYVLKGSTVNTDELKSYEDLGDEYTHNVINHAECYARGHVHTNGMENFWSLLKRTIKGTYVSVEPFHLFRYLDEQAFRFNERKDEHGDKGRFLTAMFGIIGRRLTWKRLTGQDGEPDALPAAV
jgi:transposase-like protein